MSLRFPAVILMATLVAACNLAPAYVRPVAPIPAAWPAGAAYPTASGNDGPLARSDTFYIDPDLRRLIRIGLENNRDLRQAGLRAEAFRELHRIQHAATLPEISAGATEQRQRLPGDLSPTGRPAIQAQFAIEASASYELDFFGKIKNLDRAALQTYLATDEARESAHVALVASIADAYLAWRTDQARYALVLTTLENFRHSLLLVESNEKAGLTTALAVKQARSLVLQGQTQVSVYERQMADDLNALQLLLGSGMPADVARDHGLDRIIATDMPVGLPSDLLLRRPDIRSAEHSLLASNANIGAARAAFFPSISLTAGAGTASSSLDGLFGGGSGTWTFLPSISVPIFNGGRLKAEERYAELSKDIDVARYEGVIQQAFREVSDGLAARSTFVDQLHGQGDQIQNAREYLVLSHQRFDQGLDGYITVLDAERTLLDVQQQLLTSQLQQLTAEVDLFRALGGGWDAGPEGRPQPDVVAAQP